jgi:hypothetical protein
MIVLPMLALRAAPPTLVAPPAAVAPAPEVREPSLEMRASSPLLPQAGSEEPSAEDEEGCG